MIRIAYCLNCKKEFSTNLRLQKYCCKTCATDLWMKRAGRYKSLDVPTGTVGAISELQVAVDLLVRGYAVFRATSQSCFCDLIAIKDNSFMRVEVRTGYWNHNGTPSFPRNTNGPIDCFGIYFPRTKQIRYYDPTFKELTLSTRRYRMPRTKET